MQQARDRARGRRRGPAEPGAAGLRLVAVVLGLAVATACSGTSSANREATTGSTPSAAAEAPVRGGKLTYGLDAESDGFDPTKGRWTIPAFDVANAVYDPLVALDADGRPQPYLLQSFESNADATSWTFHLRPGVRYHDGTPFDAAAYAKAVDAFMTSPLTGPAAQMLVGATVVDPLTLRIDMRRPWVAYPVVLTGQAGYIPAPATLADPQGTRRPIGTGPFRFKEWVTDSKLVLVRNPDYWRTDAAGAPLPYLDEVEFRPITDNQSRLAALQSGDLDVMVTTQPSQVAQLQDLARSGDFQVVVDEGSQDQTFVMLNNQKAPLDDVRVRRALAYATDTAALAEVAGAPPDKISDSAIATPSPFYRAQPTYPRNDLAKAQALIAEHERDHGPVTITLATTPDPAASSLVQAIAEQWKRVGVDVQIQAVEQTQLIVTVVTGAYDAAMWRQFGEVDPDAGYHWWASETIRPFGSISLNFARIADPEVDQALLAGRTSTDPAVRADAYARLQARMTDQVPYVWLWETTFALASSTSVRDLANGPLPDGRASIPFLNGSHRLTQTWIRR